MSRSDQHPIAAKARREQRMSDRGAGSEFRTGLPALIFATLGVALGYAALPYFIGNLIIPLQTEFGWNRGDVTLTGLWSAVGLAVALPFVGALADRRGTRFVSLIFIPLFALTVLGLFFFNGPLALFLAWYALIGVVGAGVSTVIYAKVVAHAFDKSRGFALGILAAGLGAVGLIFPTLMGTVVAEWGWRHVYLVMAILAVVPLVALAFTRNLQRAVTPAQAAALPGMTPRQALRTREFWTLLVVFVLLGWALLSMVPHFIPLLIDSGVDPVQAAMLSSLVGVGTLVARPILGWLFDRIYAIHVAVPVFLLAAVGFVALIFGGTALAPLTALLVGIAFGAEIDLISYLSTRYLGKRAFGVLYGLIYSAFSIGGALGPVAAGYLFAAQGTYQTALIISIVLLVVSVVMLVTLPRYDRGRYEEAVPTETTEPVIAR
ncbi:MFS transporter [Microbacterium caowuchunii]|uniref:MFS transporter n=1 Tax=Microbacterium caowuchunii TaxID=2614638 RepID=A0A5N0TII3_9MICO|nr:MFS transporter [Microbacterium caowuchunii]KAA9134411.1 MFS transporter [Microbacterium caowuchunii]